MAYMIEAADIHRRLPGGRIRGYRTLWPDTLKDDWERYYDAVNGYYDRLPPMPRQVTFHEEVMAWLRWLNRYEQQLVWMRANNMPWKIMTDQFRRSKTTLWRDTRAGLAKIASSLNALDPQGVAYKKLKD